MKKLSIGLIAASGVITTTLGSAYLYNGFAHGEWDPTALQQQVQHVTSVTDNHEGRITNLENTANTPSGAPTPTPVVITKVVTEAAPQQSSSAPLQTPLETPAETPPPIVIAWYTPTGGCDGKIFYHVHWSDGNITDQSDKPTTGTSIGNAGQSCNTGHFAP